MSPLAFSRRICGRAVNSTYMLALVATVLACAPQGSLGKDLPAGSDGAGSTDAAAEGSSTADAVDGSGSGSAASSTGAGEGTSSSSSSSGSSGEGSTTAAEACLPTAEDTACAVCWKGHCCAEWMACQASLPCTCIDGCIADGGDPTACVETHCGGPNDDWTHLHQCSAEPCVDVC
jgi:hypothetical protein